MKCTFCGGEVGADELRCPYCNQENLIAYKRQSELAEETDKNKQEAKKIINDKKFIIFDKFLKRGIIALIVLFILMMAVYLVISLFLDDEFSSLRRPKNYVETLESYYNNGEYDKLYLYVEKYDIYGSDNKETYDYSQLSQFYYYLIQYRENLYEVAEYLSGNSDKEKLRSYHLESVFRYGYEVIVPDIGVYEEISESNAKIFEGFKEEVIVDWMVWLQLTREEIEELIADSDYFNSRDNLEKLMNIAIERLGIEIEE